MKRVAVTGLSGVLGSVFLKEIPEDFEIIDLYNKSKSKNKKIKKSIHLNLLNSENTVKSLFRAEPDVILHLAGRTHIDSCEDDRKNGKRGVVWKTNVEGTRVISHFAAKNNIKLIFLSTECVFDGKEGFYNEKSKKNPINWYGETKHFAEEAVLDSGVDFSILRSVVAYHKKDQNKTIYGKILKQLNSRNELVVVGDQFLTPTYTYDITNLINQLLLNSKEGIFHLSSPKAITPYNFAKLIAENSNLDKKIFKVKLKDLYDEERAKLRLKNASLDSEKTMNVFKIKPKSPKEVINES